MYPVFTPRIRTQLIQSLNRDSFQTAEYHIYRLRAEIDRAKCLKANDGLHRVRGSLIRKLTARRYRELRQTWDMLTR